VLDDEAACCPKRELEEDFEELGDVMEVQAVVGSSGM